MGFNKRIPNAKQHSNNTRVEFQDVVTQAYHECRESFLKSIMKRKK